jgi:hypothetical protein
MKITRSLFLAAASVLALSGCTINLGASNSTEVDEPAAEEPADNDSSNISEVQIESLWRELAEAENAYEQGDISRSPNGVFGLMAAPTLRLFEFEGESWVEVSNETYGTFNLPPAEHDYRIQIQSSDLTEDGAIDYVVNFSPAPWDLFDVPNQGRDHGTVISNHGGPWRSLPMVEVDSNFIKSSEHSSVESIQLVDGTLFGQWFGSCGRPCGTHIYKWDNAYGLLEGQEATKRQARFFGRPTCIDFTPNYVLPLKLCDEGQPVGYVQDALNALGYELSYDQLFGPGTRFAVQYYQRVNSIRATGEVDFETWKSLFEGVGLPGFDLDGDGVIAPEELSGT